MKRATSSERTTSAVALGRRDWLLAGSAGLVALVLFVATLAPSVVGGDIAELQYSAYRLGIPHPNGYPLYLLLGHLWSLLPWESVAWGMNLLSACAGALSVAALFMLLRISGLRYVAALIGALCWAAERTLWHWARAADRYTLLMLLAIACLAVLLAWRASRDGRLFLLAALLGGALMAVHVMAPLFLIPVTVLILTAGPALRMRWRFYAGALLLFVLPAVLYLYVPLRGLELWNSSAIDRVWGVPEVVLHGLVHPMFGPSQERLIWYVTHGVPIRLDALLGTAISRWQELAGWANTEFGWLALVAALFGLVVTTARNRAWGIALILLLVADILSTLYNWHGNVEAYFLPANLVLIIGLATGIDWLFERLPSLRLPQQVRPTLALVGLILPVLFFLRNLPAFDRSTSVAPDQYWRTVLSLPLEERAGLLAHWGDLTPFWYMQQVEGLRPDLLGLYYPSLELLQKALRLDEPIYLTGPLVTGWYGDISHEARLVPWGPLVRLSALDKPPPRLPVQGSKVGIQLDDELLLTTASLPETGLTGGTTVPITLTWRSLAALPADTHISFRFYQADRRVMQQDERLISSWFPVGSIAEGLDFWSRYDWKVPAGLLPGDYAVYAVVYRPSGDELRPVNGAPQIKLGTVHIYDSGRVPIGWLPRPTLGACLSPGGEPARRYQGIAGSLVTVDTTFEVLCLQEGEVTLRYAAHQDRQSRVLAEVPLNTVSGSDNWQPGQVIRLPVQLRLPRDLLPGEYGIDVRAVDTATGRELRRRIMGLPLPGSSSQVGSLSVGVRPHQTAVPALSHSSGARFGKSIELVGYNRIEAPIRAGHPVSVTIAWRSVEPTNVNHHVFVQLLGADGRIAAQRDAAPGGDGLPTSMWLPGEVVVADYTLVSETPVEPGDYSLIVGLYDPVTMQRLPLAVGSEQQSSDSLSLGALRVVPAAP